MREFDALGNYPPPKEPRLVGRGIRTIENRITASYRDERFFDGDRNNGYGGFKYDGRWVEIVKGMQKEYSIPKDGSVLQLWSEKGFILNDFKQEFPNMRVCGVETSKYAREHSMENIREFIVDADVTNLPFEENEFDFVIGLGVVYCQTLENAIKVLQEIQRVSKGKSFITLGSYETEEEYWLFHDWTVLGTTMLKPDEWRKVMEHAGYTGDYCFTGAKKLNLKRKYD